MDATALGGAEDGCVCVCVTQQIPGLSQASFLLEASCAALVRRSATVDADLHWNAMLDTSSVKGKGSSVHFASVTGHLWLTQADVLLV